jgi:phosphoribosylamine---glycine ligase
LDILLIGGGGREAALAWKLAQSPEVHTIWTTDQNPGFPSCVKELPNGDHVEEAVKLGVGLVVVGPEGPLADGIVDRARLAGVPAFGPTRAAAQLESSKGFAKDFMARHNIPTAAYGRFSDRQSAIDSIEGPCVVKADGLAAGKGVLICANKAEAIDAVEHVFGGAFGTAGAEVVIEELLEGPEVSVLALCDGERFLTLPPAQDHKRRFEGDKGPNTGGMGAYAPVDVPEGLMELVGESVIEPTLRGMAAEGAPFTGVLYVGLMLTKDGPKVLEFNCRFGDPECQPIMSLIDEDILPLMLSCAHGELRERPVAVKGGAACCVVMASGGYPGPIVKGYEIDGLEHVVDGVVVFQAGTKRTSGGVVTDGGRVLGVTAVSGDIKGARDLAYSRIKTINFNGASWRKDIAWRAIIGE